ncbi:UBN2 domain-containing protein [Cephalotus follicularis]|uniref:UBN2 domain-containing protein n=1 Tax=Cephalotus follicularis TaxID=3775 RepID=A0A1Q3BTV6_CEPFO|nr:UBN2 domain-containing protein [Cephalotus follicularis]
MCLMVMHMSMSEAIHGGVHEFETTKQFLESMKEKFVESEKVETGTLMTSLTNMYYDGNGNMCEHIMKTLDVVSKMKTIDVVISFYFLVHLALNSLPLQFGQLKVTYNALREKWGLNELISICAQEKGEKVNLVHHANGKKASKYSKKPGKFNKKNFHSNAHGGPEPVKFKDHKCFFYKKKGHVK